MGMFSGRDGHTARRRFTGGVALRVLAAALVPAAAGLLPVAPAAAQSAQQVAFNIPAQDLNGAVLAFGQASGVSVFSDASKLRGRRSSPVVGTMTAQEGLGRLLAGTGLSYRFTGANRATIVDSSSAATGGAGQGETLDTVDVETAGNGTVGYVATRSTASTKTDTPLIQTPQSISVVTREELTDRAVQSLIDAVAYTPGVRTGQSGYDPRYDAFSIRGFDVTYTGIYRDGLRLPGANMSVFKIEPYNVDSVTVLRGPTSALYGLGSPGGLVDVTSKRPVDKEFGEIEGSVGSWNWLQGRFDVGGRLASDGSVLYRLTGVARDSGSPNTLGEGDNDMYSIAPAVTWLPNDSTRITFLGELQKSKTPASLPYYAWTGEGDTFSNGSSDYNATDQEQGRIGYALEHDFNDVFTFRQNLRYGAASTYVRYNGISEEDPNAGTASRYTGFVHDNINSFVVDNQLQAKFNTGAIEHKVLVGLDYSYLALNGGIGYGTASDIDLASGAPLGPVYDPPMNASRYRQKTNQTGIYVQEQANIDRWIVTLTGRQDFVTQRDNDLLSDTSEKTDDTAFTYRAGLTYQFDNGIAPYVSYSTNFAPNTGVDANNNSFDPTTSRQIEGGVKFAPQGFDGFFTASVFQIDQEDGLVTDENNPFYQVQTGKVRGRGFELEAVANLGAGLKVRGAYSYLDIENTGGDPETVGLKLSGNPEHSFSAWADYEFQPGTALAGLGIGAGVRYIGSSFGNSLNTIENSAATLVDAKISYELEHLGTRFKGWSMQLNATNLLDDDYITCDAGYCYKGQPRTLVAGLKYRW
ncbi:TonB-dependent siderophore receptor [Ancylobacter sp. 6x-1]|uniref:TonB-dependent siderophore receptor n=1 Tax=Ancylobacter crimeensis TaxID=2579147 RepID=A0ABT0DB39_9HYPH|nr:TonB-dependent siderophore receptor [Ancylobacter crimeensis]MCK0197174.1 TonB-dependent siderophore receptor [Ancylobacter crimeensis]